MQIRSRTILLVVIVICTLMSIAFKKTHAGSFYGYHEPPVPGEFNNIYIREGDTLEQPFRTSFIHLENIKLYYIIPEGITGKLRVRLLSPDNTEVMSVEKKIKKMRNADWNSLSMECDLKFREQYSIEFSVHDMPDDSAVVFISATENSSFPGLPDAKVNDQTISGSVFLDFYFRNDYSLIATVLAVCTVLSLTVIINGLLWRANIRSEK